jgi:hypothetical protein
MCSAKGLQASPWRGCPIRTSPDQSLLAAPRGLSQPSTSFIGSWCQGIHRAPLLARRLDLSNSPSRQDQRSQKNLACSAVADPARVRANGLYLSAQLLFDSSGTHPALLRAPVVALPPGQPHDQSVEAPRLALQFVSCPYPSFTLCSKAQKWPDTVEPLRHTRKLSSEPYAVGVSNCLMVRFSWSGMRAHTSQRPVRPAKEHYISPPLNRASHRRPPRSKNLQRPAVRGAYRQSQPGGAEGTRTPDIRLAKAALSQLSYGPVFDRRGWASLESNQGPQSYQDCALAD